MIELRDKSDIEKLQPGDMVKFDTHCEDNITGKVIKKLPTMIIVETEDIPYLKVLY